jgi:hypothetical protein
VPATQSFEYALIRVVPRVERGEFINAGVIVFCLSRKFLGCRTELNEARLRALWPQLEVEQIRQHLGALSDVCTGLKEAGPIAALSQRERFHWLVAPRSTVIQISPVHSGLCDSPEEALSDLFARLVLSSSPERCASSQVS